MKRIFVCFLVGVCFLFLGNCVYALELDSIDVLGGYLTTDRENNEDYEGYPLFLAFNFSACNAF